MGTLVSVGNCIDCSQLTSTASAESLVSNRIHKFLFPLHMKQSPQHLLHTFTLTSFYYYWLIHQRNILPYLSSATTRNRIKHTTRHKHLWLPSTELIWGHDLYQWETTQPGILDIQFFPQLLFRECNGIYYYRYYSLPWHWILPIWGFL